MENRNLPPFFQVESELWQEEGHPLKLIWTWRKVAIYLREAASHDEKNAAFRSIRQICDWTNLSRKQVSGAISKLRKWPSKDAPFILDWNKQDNLFILRPLPEEKYIQVHRWFWDLQASNPNDREMLDYIKDVFCFVRSQYVATTSKGLRLYRCNLDGKKKPSIARCCATTQDDRSQRIRQAVDFLYRYGILKEVRKATSQPAKAALCVDLSASPKHKLPTLLSTSDIRAPSTSDIRNLSDTASEDRRGRVLSLGAVAPVPPCSSATAPEAVPACPSVQYRTSLGAVAPSLGAVAPVPPCSTERPSVQYAGRTQKPNKKPDERTPKAPRLREELTSAFVVLENEAGVIPTSATEVSSEFDVLKIETEVTPTSELGTVETSTEENEVNPTSESSSLEAANNILLSKNKFQEEKIKILEEQIRRFESSQKGENTSLSSRVTKKMMEEDDEKIAAITAAFHNSLGLTAKERISFDDEEEKERKEEEERLLRIGNLLQELQDECSLPRSSEDIPTLAKAFSEHFKYRFDSLFKEAGIPLPSLAVRFKILKSAVRWLQYPKPLGAILCQEKVREVVLARIWTKNSASCLLYDRANKFNSATEELFRDLATMFPPQGKYEYANDPRNLDSSSNTIPALTYSQVQQLPALVVNISDETLKKFLFGEDTTEKEVHHLRTLLVARADKEVREKEEIYQRTKTRPIDPQAPVAPVAPVVQVATPTPKLGPKKSIPTDVDILLANKIAEILDGGEPLDIPDSTDPTETELAEPEEDEDGDVLDVDLNEDDFAAAEGMSDDGDDEAEGWVDHHVATRAPHDPKPEKPAKQFKTPSKPKKSNEWKAVLDEIHNRRRSR